MRPFGPKKAEHPSIGDLCPLCEEPFAEGDYTTLVAIAPAGEEDRAKMEAGRPYNALAREVHWHHATEAPHHRKNCSCSEEQICEECEPIVDRWMQMQIEDAAGES